MECIGLTDLSQNYRSKSMKEGNHDSVGFTPDHAILNVVREVREGDW